MRREFLSTREGLACHREIRNRLGQALRAIYEPNLAQDLPEHLAHLLERLDERERGSRRPPARSSRSD
jgi:Anti-sigma factor NepR